jgi:hypothetical protein
VTVALAGDGESVPPDAIGSRVAITTTGADPRIFYQTISVG